MRRSVIVLGAGASGYMAAISAAEQGADVLLVEAGKPARKVLASGNGRCNLGNTHVATSCYVTADPGLLDTYLTHSDRVMRFWQQVGLVTRTDAEGRIYPWSNRAQSVADTLALLAAEQGVERYQAKVLGLQHTTCWVVRTDTGDLYADRVVLALGSVAAPKLGGSQTGLTIAAALGLACAPTRPMLVPLCTTPHPASIKGCRHMARLTLHTRDGDLSEEGEVLFADYGLSGIAAMQLSAYCRQGDSVSLDLMPPRSAEALRHDLDQRVRSGRYPTVEHLLVGWLDKPLSFAVLKEAGISPLDKPTSTLTPRALDALVATLKGWRFCVDGTLDYDNAQVMGGGVRLSQLDEHLQSRLARGLYLCGELLDVTGLCGGYNLHWAWLSGMLAGEAAGGGCDGRNS